LPNPVKLRKVHYLSKRTAPRLPGPSKVQAEISSKRRGNPEPRGRGDNSWKALKNRREDAFITEEN